MHDHRTGRFCENPQCQGPLLDTIINFNESLPVGEWTKAENAFKRANLCVVLRSSCKSCRQLCSHQQRHVVRVAGIL